MIICLLSLVGSCQQAKQVENPEYNGWKNYKVGAWIKYSVETQAKGSPKLISTRTLTLKQLTDTKAIIEEVTENQDEKYKDRESVSLAIPARVDEGTDSEGNKFNELSTGTEELSINGNTYTCKWVEVRVGLGDESFKMRIWKSDKVVGGQAKITAEQEKGDQVKTVMTASEWKDGSK